MNFRTAVLLLCLLPALGNADDNKFRTWDAAFYVSPEGSDAWSGKLADPNAGGTDGPFASLARARDAVRADFKSRPRSMTVLIRGGTYRLRETVVFTLADSAGADHTIRYAAFPGEVPVFSGAQPVGGWTRDAGSIWSAAVKPGVAFRTLYDEDGLLRRARSRGFSPLNSAPRGSGDYQTVEFPGKTLKAYARLADAELRIVPSRFWVMNLVPIESIDLATRRLRLAAPTTYPPGKNKMTNRDNAWVENVIEELDEPGEWVLDTQKGRVYLWPRNDGKPAGVERPVLTELIRVEGHIDYAGPVDQPVRGLVFEGLTFTRGDSYPWHGLTGWGLQHDWECFDKPTALVRFRGAERCAVRACVFKDSGHTAIRLDLHARGIEIAENHIHDIGGVGVLLAGYGPGTKDVNRDNRVVNNHIHHIGRQYWGSGAIFAWQSGHNRIAHNLLHHLPYTAILATGRISRSKGGTGECSRTIRRHEVPGTYWNGDWNQREPFLHARKNVIEFNDIHHVMERLGDGNAIYISGAGGGNLVQHNFCHDSSAQYINTGIRCDDDQHETLITGNLCLRLGGHGGFVSKGKNHIVNNVAADLVSNGRHRGYIVFPYGDIHGSVVEKNILYSRNSKQNPFWHSRNFAFGPPSRLSDARVDYNLYFCTKDPKWATRHLAEQREAGNETHSRQADPLFVNPDKNDFRFRPGSPAPALGIRPLQTDRAGLEPHAARRIPGGNQPDGSREDMP
jgi:hypothetical protein